MKKMQALLMFLMVCLVSVSHAQQDVTAATKILLEAIEYPEDPEAFKAALEALAAGADVNKKEWGGVTVLMVATNTAIPKWFNCCWTGAQTSKDKLMMARRP